MDITRYIVGLAVLLIATVVPLLCAHWLLLRVSSSRHRRLQHAETATAGYFSGAQASTRARSAREGSRGAVPVFPLR